MYALCFTHRVAAIMLPLMGSCFFRRCKPNTVCAFHNIKQADMSPEIVSSSLRNITHPRRWRPRHGVPIICAPVHSVSCGARQLIKLLVPQMLSAMAWYVVDVSIAPAPKGFDPQAINGRQPAQSWLRPRSTTSQSRVQTAIRVCDPCRQSGRIQMTDVR